MPVRMDIVRATMEDFFERGSVDALMRSVTEDVVLKATVTAETPITGEFRGSAGLMEYFTRIDQHLGLHAAKATAYFEDGDKVVVLGDEIQTVKVTGAEVFSEWCTVFTFEGNKIARVLVIEDHSALALAVSGRGAKTV